MTSSPNFTIIPKLNIELRTSSGDKLKFAGLSKNRGIVYVELFGKRNHFLIRDLDEESQLKVAELEVEARKNLI